MSGTDAHPLEPKPSLAGLKRGTPEYKATSAAYKRWHYANNPVIAERTRQKARDRRAMNPGIDTLRKRERWLLTTYSLTTEQFDSMLDAQGGVCALCGTDTPGGRHNTFNVDHCHSGGDIRGLLCWNCNRILGHHEKMLNNPRVTEYLNANP